MTVMIKLSMPGGRMGVFEVQPHHVPRADIPESRNWPAWFGKSVAYYIGGLWYPSQDSTTPIVDVKALRLLNNLPVQ